MKTPVKFSEHVVLGNRDEALKLALHSVAQDRAASTFALIYIGDQLKRIADMLEETREVEA
jgi:hypothetical protein